MAVWDLFSFNCKFNICAFWTEDRARLRANCQLTFPNYSHTKFKTVPKNRLSIKEYLNQSTHCKYSIKIMSPIGMPSKWEISTWLISLYKVQINCMFLNKYLAGGTISHVPTHWVKVKNLLYIVCPSSWKWTIWNTFLLSHYICFIPCLIEVFPFLLFLFSIMSPEVSLQDFGQTHAVSPTYVSFWNWLACLEGADLLDLCFKRWSFKKASFLLIPLGQWPWCPRKWVL